MGRIKNRYQFPVLIPVVPRMTAAGNPPSLEQAEPPGTAKEIEEVSGMVRVKEKGEQMTWRLSVMIVAAALLAACGGTAASAAAKPSVPAGPVTKYRNMLAGQTATTPIDLIQSVLYFAPGAASVVHT